MKSRIASTVIVLSLIVGVVGFIPPQIAQATLPASATDASVVPHYFGPYPNYANSPQAGADANVAITGDGSGATATAAVDPVSGAITGYTVTSPGSGYTTATVNVTGSGTGAAPGAVTINSSGVVTGVTVDAPAPGYVGYTTPTVTFTGGGASVQAVGSATGGVFDVTVTNGGTLYTAPIIDFDLPDDPNGVQATGSVQIDGSGVVTGVTIVNPGSGYWTAPGATIYDVNRFQPGTGTGATVTSTLVINGVNLTTFGTGYTGAPSVAFGDTTGLGSGATATASTDFGAITAIALGAGGSGYITAGIKKFVDTLPGLGASGANNLVQANGLGQYIPVAVPDTTTYPGTDYYEIAVVQYRERLSSSLPVEGTLLRGYVQLSTSVVPGAQIALTNANIDPNVAPTPILLPDGSPALGVDGPHYLGPIISATKDRPVRILFRDLLPTGVAGDLFLPVDTTIMGSGMGPLGDQTPPTNDGTVTDAVRNPACNEGFMTGMPDMCYTQNRATLHLHGGITPWISDGTPHQWITPAGETTSYPKGVSVQNVPDMPDPGPGAQTFFYTNQQSARLMFYHDHSFGITRLNVYAGEAAGYLVTDKTEKALVNGGIIPGAANTIPLVIEDKTFVPSSSALAQEDPTWNAARWGGEGNLWLPHVYMPAQNPGSPTGSSAFGRWMYGPWFWPPATGTQYGPIDNPYYDPLCDPNVILPDGSNQFCEPQQIPGTPNLSVGMEAFNDTPVVNGTAYPTATLDPSSYRLRILNAANDRFWNLQWYVADPTTLDPTTGLPTLTEVALKPAEVAAAQTDPNVYPTPNTALSPAGPDWVQIGTEGGFLPAPTTVSGHQPTTWITDQTRFDWGNVKDHSLLLAPAERADVIVDFSAYAGKTLILYNDAPAAFPARVPGYDYYTGDPNLAPSGAPSTLPGYGPNTRTIMQIHVAAATPAPVFNRTALNNAFKHHANGSGVFESSQDPIIVGQAAYNSAYGTNFASAGWCSSPSNPSAKCDGFARIQEQGGMNFKFDTLTGHQLSLPIQPKGIHDEMNSSTFDPFGRMQANMGVEAPGATPLLQNIILYPYTNPSTEVLNGFANQVSAQGDFSVTPISTSSDGTQIWKITHNGVDTHPIHFHLYDVQLINRVTWDNIIMPPEPSELGWKDTVRVSPLQDTIVAVRPIIPKLPFGVLDSHRLLNPALPEGATDGFNNVDVNGNPTPAITNVMTDFFWEYVWHCHILSHEEMDMMRPVNVVVPHSLPATPDPVTALGNAGVDLTWTDGTPITYTDPLTFANWGDPAGEVGYHIKRADVAPDLSVGPYTTIANVQANATAYHDPVGPGNFSYIVAAYNESGESQSTPVQASSSTVTLTVTLAGTGLGSVTSAPAGIDCGVTCAASFNPAVSVTLTPTADVSSTFTGWSGDCTGTGACIVAMNVPRNVTATFTLNTFLLTVGKATSATGTTGTGVVTSASTPAGVPADINCGATCTATYDYNTVVTLTAAPDVSSTFDGWTGDCTNATGDCVVTMTAARNVQAIFTLKKFDLTVTVAGTGSPAGTGNVTTTSNPAGPGEINCPTTTPCVATYDYNTVVTLTATPTIDSTFTGWTGAGCAAFGTGTCDVTMTAARAVTATFARKTPNLAVTKAGTGFGLVTSVPTGISCGVTCAANFDYGTVVTLTAAPNISSTFAGWSGACTGTSTCVATMTAARAVTATFTLKTPALTVTFAGNGGGRVTSNVVPGIDCVATCSANFDYGQLVTLTAAPDAISTFRGWTGACTGLGTCSVTMTQVQAVTATFAISYLPDGMLSTGNGTFVGNNIYNTNGTSQTRSGTYRRGATTNYSWRAQNDGVLADTFLFSAPADPAGFRIRFFAGGTNVTAAVHAGTYARNVAPGAQVTLRVEIRVNAGATVGAVDSALLTITSQHRPAASDVVLARITAR